jgi:hypothetical protein
MLWAMLIYYFSSSSGMDLLVKDIEKPVKQYVQNEATAKQIISINKEMRSENESANKEIKAEKKLLAKVNRNRLATDAEFDEAFDAIDQMRATAREKILDGRFKMKELMTAGEWSDVYAAADQKN